MKLNYSNAFVTIAAVEFEKMLSFYSNLLTLSPEIYIPNVYAEFKLGGFNLGIFHPAKNHLSEFNSSSASPLSICLEVINLKDAISCLQSLGYPPPGNIINASHGQEIYAYDPEGNRLILHEKKSVT